MKKIQPKDIFTRVKTKLPVGVRANQLCIKEKGCWHPLVESDIPIKIRSLYSEDVQGDISSACIKEATECLMQDPELQLHFTEETEEKYVSIENGVFNTETGKLIRNPEGLQFGYRLDFSYIPDAAQRSCDTFERFCKTSFPFYTEEKRLLLLQMIGYVISDYRRAKTGFFLIGESNSGKSVILELVRRVLPAFTATAVPLYRLENRFNLAKLADARVNINTELSEKSFAAPDIFKALTSNETVTAEHKGKKPFEFQLRCKTLNAGNIMPNLNNMEGMGAMLNRMTILLFPVSISENEQDANLAEKLWHERDSIFSAALDALVDLAKSEFRFEEPEDTVKLKCQMRSEEYAFENFIRERCLQEVGARVYFVTLYQEFCEYCTDNLIDAKLTKAQFSQRLVRIPGLEKRKFRIDGGKPLYGVEGLRLKKSTEYTPQDSALYDAENGVTSEKHLRGEKSRNNGTMERKEDPNER